jgi:hypothetical protein
MENNIQEKENNKLEKIDMFIKELIKILGFLIVGVSLIINTFLTYFQILTTNNNIDQNIILISSSWMISSFIILILILIFFLFIKIFIFMLTLKKKICIVLIILTISILLFLPFIIFLFISICYVIKICFSNLKIDF